MPTPVQYCTVAELGQFGISPEVTADPDAPIDSAVLDGILQACSAQADGYLQSSGRITLPLTAWGVDLKMCVAKLAAWEIMAVRVGHNPDDPNNFVWRDRRDEALKWLDSVARGLVMPVGIVDSKPTEVSTGSVIYTEPKRGW
jgi:phage gp36-like protein